MNRVDPANFTKQVFGESLVSLEEDTSTNGRTPVGNGEKLDDSAKNTAENSTGSSQEIYFTPHPPEKSKSQQGGRRNKKKRDAKRNKVGSISQSSEEGKLLHQQHNEVLSDNRLAGSKLPPLLKESSSAIENKPNAEKLCNVHTLNLKPLSPIIDNVDVADNFKAKQSLERGKHDLRNKGPVKRLDPIGQVSRVDSINEEANRFQVDKNLDINKQKSISNNNKDNYSDEDNKSEKTLTDVSSNDLVSDTDSDSPKTPFYPKAPSDTPPTHHRPHRNSLSLTSVKECPEPVDRHSDTEAIRRARNGSRQSKELWGKAKVVTLLPRVPASRARDRNSNFVKEELEKYLPERKLTVFIGTWNMHGEKVWWQVVLDISYYYSA